MVAEPIDIYRYGASIAFEVPQEAVTKQQRQLFKEHCWLIFYNRSTTKENALEIVQRIAEHLRPAFKELR